MDRQSRFTHLRPLRDQLSHDAVVLQPFDTIGDRRKSTVLSELFNGISFTFVLVIQAQLVSFRWGLSTSCRSMGARSGG